MTNKLHSTLAEYKKQRLEKILRSQMPFPAPSEEDEQPHEIDWNIVEDNELEDDQVDEEAPRK